MLVVIGHWLLSVMTYRGGEFGRDNPLVLLPWTQWLTWLFQVVPVFFAVAGFASAVSWARLVAGGAVSREQWIRRRVARTLGPTVVYAVFVLAVIAALMAAGPLTVPLLLKSWTRFAPPRLTVWTLKMSAPALALLPATMELVRWRVPPL